MLRNPPRVSDCFDRSFATAKSSWSRKRAARVDMQRIMACAPDGYILNLRSGVILVKLLELTLMDQQFLALPRPAPLRASSRPKSHDHEDAADLGDASDTRHGRNGSPLSQREQQILTHLVRGNSNKAIARLCNITESTVKVHLKAILRKTDSRNRTKLPSGRSPTDLLTRKLRFRRHLTSSLGLLVLKSRYRVRGPMGRCRACRTTVHHNWTALHPACQLRHPIKSASRLTPLENAANT